LARLWQVISGPICSYSLPAFSYWDYFAPECEPIEVRIGLGESHWQSCSWFRGRNPRGELLFIDLPKYPSELLWRC
jgi:hypothetical protein